MQSRVWTAALAAALVTSIAAIAAPREYSDAGLDTPGAFFNCIVAYPGPGGFRTGPCWLDSVGRNG